MPEYSVEELLSGEEIEDVESDEPNEDAPVKRITAEPLQLGNRLVAHKNRVYLVGVELEGGWDKLPKGVTLVHDGSVVVGAAHSGELPSPPLKPEAIMNWMRQSYPTAVNITCGLHVHMSFKRALHYSVLMKPEFPATMLAYLRSWGTDQGLSKDHPLFSRLAGDNQYCTAEFFADDQATHTRKRYDRQPGEPHRYTAISYPWGIHETIECRVLPMFADVETAIKAVMQVIAVTNATLALHRSYERRVKASLILSGLVKATECTSDNTRLYSNEGPRHSVEVIERIVE